METDSPPDGPAVLIGQSQAVKDLVGYLLSEKHLGYDGYILKTFGDRLVVVGQDYPPGRGPDLSLDERYNADGRRFAVFALLEELGCRFFSWHPDGEHIPKRKTITLGDLNIISKPQVAMRLLWISHDFQFTDKTIRAFRLWRVCNGLGGVWIPHGHNYQWICSGAEYFEKHPEYFSYIRKQNRRIRSDHGRGQLCLSNAEVLQLVVEKARSTFDGGNADIWGFSLSPNDSDHEDWCQCNQWLAMDSPEPNPGYLMAKAMPNPSDHTLRFPTVSIATRVLQFNNQVAEELAKMLWDPNLDEDALIEEYFELYFQEAAKPMQKYYQQLDKVGHKPGYHNFYVHWENLTPQIIGQLELTLAKAEHSAKQNIVRRRIRREQEALTAYSLFVQAWSSYQQWSSQGTEQNRQRAREVFSNAIDYLKEIDDRELVNDMRMIRSLKEYEQKLVSGQDVSTSTRNINGWSDQETFGDLWQEYEKVAEVPRSWLFRTDPQDQGRREK